jgi:hypothetical protein
MPVTQNKKPTLDRMRSLEDVKGLVIFVRLEQILAGKHQYREALVSREQRIEYIGSLGSLLW